MIDGTTIPTLGITTIAVIRPVKMVEFGVMSRILIWNGNTVLRSQVFLGKAYSTSLTLLILACDDKCQNPHPNHLGWDYTGDESKTVSGLKCQKWNTWYPHQPTNYDWEPNWDHNYCRNPDFSEGGVWCYTTDPNTRREYCSQVDSCGETCQDRSSKGRNYQGTQSKTRTGIKCQKWNEDKPHHHSKPAVDHNYCRNPDSDDGGVWCFTTDPNVQWEYCDVEG